MKNTTLFFDRDGVLVKLRKNINGGLSSFHHLSCECLVPEMVELIRKKFPTYCYMVTNQPDVARGLIDAATVYRDNTFVAKTFGLADFRCCEHDNADFCDCRKPKPGMLLDLAKAHKIDLKNSWLIGDRASDITAGKAAGTRTLFVDHGISMPHSHNADHSVSSYSGLIDWLTKL